ncbi:putative E3 ubiquitin-protein ligase LIN isoform X2 [Phoenix dactylifera]|uniref:RING-type E3 ubiquitin transferase n=1 Tax=Phoenix dactylifera TaxID=42345 RepID=A0A8B8ZPW0_PHODC|nr:putative E3 ubiquitin-protein ligase LIN isoform X2 [Phoenix dactylifera]
MARSQRMPLEGKELAHFLTSTVGSFVQDRLIDRDRRAHHKEQCAERLAAEGCASPSSAAAAAAEVRYSDQAVLANLDWGIDALEEAITTSNPEAKLARLGHAERMLQVCALLDPAQATAGVPNSYLSAWAHLHLAFLARLRGDSRGSALHALEMFDVDPFFARIDFAPELWEALFLLHMASIVGWYVEARHRVVVETIPDAGDLSLTVDLDDQLFRESLVLSVRPDQADKMRDLEKRYGEALDHSTRMYARYYKDALSQDPAAAAPGRKGVPVLPPIAEPPMTPLHEVSRSIPDYVKFGPILPKSAGFSPVLKNRGDEDVGAPCLGSDEMNVNPSSAEKLEKSSGQIINGALVEEAEADNDSDGGDVSRDSEIMIDKQLPLNSMRQNMDYGKPKFLSSRMKDRSTFLKSYSPVDSPKSLSPKVSSPKPLVSSEKKPKELLRLSSSHVTSPPETTSPLDSSKSTPELLSPKPAKEPKPLPHFQSGHCPTGSPSPHYYSDLNMSSIGSDGEGKLQRSCRNNFSGTRNMTKAHASKNSHLLNDSHHIESEDDMSRCSSSLRSSDSLMRSRARPPKDFVCPITGQLFSDPVTLETGQTFERRAIQEWIKRGNKTCPITRQLLSSTILPKTNYVLKRLIASWMEQNPDIAQEFSYSETTSASVSPISSMEFFLEPKTSANFSPPLAQTRLNTKKNERRCKRFTRAAVTTSPTGIISQAASETILNGLKPYTSCLCTFEDLQECEEAVLTIARIWKDSRTDPRIHAYLSKPTIINGFVEILSASTNREALRAAIYVLSELVSADETVGETLNSADTNFDCLAVLLINGLAEAAVLICQLMPTYSQLSSHNLIPSLVQLIMEKNDQMDDFCLVLEPNGAAVTILQQILLGEDESSRSRNALSVIAANGLPALIKCMDQTEGRVSIVSILLSCMRADKGCRYLIANRVELAPVLELFHAGDESTKSICIDFISELVCLNRRTICNQILQIIKDEGAFSTMHTFLVYLHMASIEQQPAVAGLLLQLDLLVEPRKMSMYREESIDAIIEALKRKDFPICQSLALDMLTSLSGRLNSSGKPLTEAWLLKVAGVNNLYDTSVKEEKIQTLDDTSVEMVEMMEKEEKSMNAWEKRVAFVLCNHDDGAIFEALGQCLTTNSLEMAKKCLVIATWLAYMLSCLPDTGIRTIAANCFLDQFINVLHSSRNLEEKVLATLALKSFIIDSDSLRKFEIYAPEICKPLRKLKRHSSAVADLLKAIMNMPSVDRAEFFSCTELFEIDSIANGEVLSLIYSKGWLFSSHSDGTIKVWETGRRVLKLIQEVHAHSKAVTCLYIPPSGDKLYSGSHDKTIRVWAIGPDEIRPVQVWAIGPDKIRPVQVHDTKDTVNCLAANANLLCFTSQGTGAKVYDWNGSPKHVNFNKNVKCLAIMEDSLYCGCSGYSIQVLLDFTFILVCVIIVKCSTLLFVIYLPAPPSSFLRMPPLISEPRISPLQRGCKQEVDLRKCRSNTFYSGTRKLLGKQTIHALCIQDGILFAGGSSVDGTSGKAFSLSTKTPVGSFSTALDIHCIYVTNDFVFTGTKCGVIEVWLRARLTRVASIKVGGGANTKVTTVASDTDGELLFSGSADGKIQVWALE